MMVVVVVVVAAVAVAVAVAAVVVVIIIRLMPRILHDFEHLHGFPATLNFNIALTHGLEKGLARMP